MWKLSEHTAYTALAQEFSWIRDMENVPQDLYHHAEGNVAIHTEWVVRELVSLAEYQALSAENQEILRAAAWMHDIEKRSTTVIDEAGRISSPGHSRRGAQTAQSLLYKELNAPFHTRQAIKGLVRHHGLPIWVFEKENPQKAVLKASLEVNTEHLYLLAKADMLGRICQDQAEMLYRVELFKEFCIENQCWGEARKFPSEAAKFSYFRNENQSPDYEPYEKFSCEVILLSGIAGSGKDTYYERNFKDWKSISLDNLRRAQGIEHGDKQGNGRVIQAAKEQAKAYLRKGESFVWNATNISWQIRDSLLELFATYHARTRIVYIEAPYQRLHFQNKHRPYPIPHKAVEWMIEKLEVPRLWEAHAVEYVV